jgi:hypothetical protein
VGHLTPLKEVPRESKEAAWAAERLRMTINLTILVLELPITGNLATFLNKILLDIKVLAQTLADLAL